MNLLGLLSFNKRKKVAFPEVNCVSCNVSSRWKQENKKTTTKKQNKTTTLNNQKESHKYYRKLSHSHKKRKDSLETRATFS